MRIFLMIGFALMLASAAPPSAFAAHCPASATEASQAIWPAGTIPHNQLRSAIHPCGKRITCSGGKLNSNVKRTCSWH